MFRKTGSVLSPSSMPDHWITSRTRILKLSHRIQTDLVTGIINTTIFDSRNKKFSSFTIKKTRRVSKCVSLHISYFSTPGRESKGSHWGSTFFSSLTDCFLFSKLETEVLSKGKGEHLTATHFPHHFNWRSRHTSKASHLTLPPFPAQNNPGSRESYF